MVHYETMLALMIFALLGFIAPLASQTTYSELIMNGLLRLPSCTGVQSAYLISIWPKSHWVSDSYHVKTTASMHYGNFV